MASPLFVIVLVLDLVSLSQPKTSVTARMNDLVWFIFYSVQLVWSINVIQIITVHATNRISKSDIIRKHLSLFISASGLIVALIGAMGKHSVVWELVMAIVADIASVILTTVGVVLICDSKINLDVFRQTHPRPWVLTFFGKVLIICHVVLLCHAFLSEGSHLEESMDEFGEHNVNDAFGALEFVFYFWRIEFHLAIIERVNLIL